MYKRRREVEGGEYRERGREKSDRMRAKVRIKIYERERDRIKETGI